MARSRKSQKVLEPITEPSGVESPHEVETLLSELKNTPDSMEVLARLGRLSLNIAAHRERAVSKLKSVAASVV